MTHPQTLWSLPGSSPRVPSLVGRMRSSSLLLGPFVGYWEGPSGAFYVLILIFSGIWSFVDLPLLALIVGLTFNPEALRPPSNWLETLPMTPGDTFRSDLQVGIEWAVVWSALLASLQFLVRLDEWTSGWSGAQAVLLGAVNQSVILVGAVCLSRMLDNPKHASGSSPESQVAGFFLVVALYLCFQGSQATQDSPSLPWVGILALGGGAWVLASALWRQLQTTGGTTTPAVPRGPGPRAIWTIPALIGGAVYWLGPHLGIPPGLWAVFGGLALWQLQRVAVALPSWRLASVRVLDLTFGVGLAGLWWAISHGPLDRSIGYFAIVVLALAWNIALPGLDRVRRGASREERERVAATARRSLELPPGVDVQRPKAPEVVRLEPVRREARAPKPIPGRRAHLKKISWARARSMWSTSFGRILLAMVVGLPLFAGEFFAEPPRARVAMILLVAGGVAFFFPRGHRRTAWLRVLPLRPMEIVRWRLRAAGLTASMLVLVLAVVQVPWLGLDPRGWRVSLDALAILGATVVFCAAAALPTQGRGLSLAQVANGFFQGVVVLVWRAEMLTHVEGSILGRWGIEALSWGVVTLLLGWTVWTQVSASGRRRILAESQWKQTGDLGPSSLPFLLILCALFWLYGLWRGEGVVLVLPAMLGLLVLSVERVGLLGYDDLDGPGPRLQRARSIRGVAVALDLVGILFFGVLLDRYTDGHTTPTVGHFFGILAWVAVCVILDRRITAQRSRVTRPRAPVPGGPLIR